MSKDKPLVISRRAAILGGLGLAASIPASAFASTVVRIGYKPDGSIYEGLVTLHGKTYLYEGGVLFKGGQKDYKGSRYFYTNDGHMAVSETVTLPDGTQAKYDANGLLVSRPDEGWYELTCTNASLVLDLYSNLGAVGTNLKLYTSNSSAAQRFYLQHADDDNAFRLVHNSGRVIARESAASGANVSLAESADNDLQLWALDGDSLRPVNDAKQALCAASAEVNANVLCSSDTNSYATWNLTAVDGPAIVDSWYVIKNAASGKVLDVAYMKVGNSINIQPHAVNGSNAQNFQVSGTTIKTFCGKALDIAYGSSEEGTNVQQYENNNGANQTWKFTYNGAAVNIINPASGNCITETNGNIDMRKPTGAAEQDWYFIKISTPSIIKSMILAQHLGDWDFTDWDYVERMRQRAIANGNASEGSWYATNDCDFPCRDTFFKYTGGEWRPVACFYSVPGHLSDQGHSVSWKGIWAIDHRNTRLGSRNYVTCYMVCNPVGDHNCQAYHDGWTRGQTGYQYGGCNGLTTEHAEWVYDTVPNGCKVDVCGNATPTDQSPSGDKTHVETYSINDPFIA